MKISHTASSINVGCFEIMSVYDVFNSFYKFSLPNLFKDLLDSFGIYLETHCQSLELFLIFWSASNNCIYSFGAYDSHGF